MRRRFALCFVAAILGVPAVAGATTITFNTSDSQFDGLTDNQGWWTATEANFDGNTNTITGEGSDTVYRSFFTFDLSTLDLTGQTLLSATFEAVRYGSTTPDATETIAFFDVSTDAATLNNTVGPNAAIFTDLGTGTTYGSFDVPEYTFSTTELLSFSLNAAALADIAAGAGGFFSIGGSLQSITPGGSFEIIFNSSSGTGVQRLILETTGPSNPAVPEPATLLLLGTGLIGAGVRRYRQRR